MTKKARINQQMGQNNQKDQKGPKMTAAVMLVQNNQNNQKIWSPHNSESAFFLGHPVCCVMHWEIAGLCFLRRLGFPCSARWPHTTTEL